MKILRRTIHLTLLSVLKDLRKDLKLVLVKSRWVEYFNALLNTTEEEDG
jgi:hypothetical protein